jgi:DinB superfamily
MALRLPTPSDPGLRPVLDRQVQLMFECATDVLAGVTLDECLWQIDSRSWTVHERDGRWFGELDEEPPDIPTPTLAWTMWHPIWWLRTLLAHARAESPPEVLYIEWPGPDATLPTLRDLWREWAELTGQLDEDDLRSGALTRFPYEDGRPFAHVLGWAAMELTKNLSEMCVLRRLPGEVERHLAR